MKHKNNIYILFGWEGIHCRPNCDPFKNDLRVYPNHQVYTTSEHVKYHWRRGIRAAGELLVGKERSQIFYDKSDTFDGRTAALLETFGIDAKSHKPEDAFQHCLDIPLLGYTHAVTGESFNAVNAVNFLYLPVTPHVCDLLSLSTNNAFVGKKNGKQKNAKKKRNEEEKIDDLGESTENENKSAAGSHTLRWLPYGFFLGLAELNIPTLLDNIKDHKLIQDPEKWIKLAIDGLWSAYTVQRSTSCTQRGQQANFLLAWEPQCASEEIDRINLDPRYLLGANPPTIVGLPGQQLAPLVRKAIEAALPNYVAQYGHSSKNQIAYKSILGRELW